MSKILKCGDVAPGCNAEIRGELEPDVLRKAAEHAKTDPQHGKYSSGYAVQD
jgi:predicted small metal-binding protein